MISRRMFVLGLIPSIVLVPAAIIGACLLWMLPHVPSGSSEEGEYPELSELRVAVALPPTIAKARVQGWLFAIAGDRAPEWSEFESHGTPYFAEDSPHVLRWEYLGRGRYWLAVGYWGQTSGLRMLAVDVDRPVVERSVSLPEPPFPQFHQVRLLDPDGAPVPRAEWRKRYDLPGSVEATPAHGVRQVDGTHLVCVEYQLETTDGIHRIEARVDDLGRVIGAFDPQRRKPLEMRFLVPASVRVVLDGVRGSRYEHRLMVGWDPAGPLTLSTSRGVDRSGGVDVPVVQPGEGEFVVFARTPHGRANPVARHPIRLRSGHQSVHLPIPELHRFTVVWSGEGRPRVELTALDRRGAPHWATVSWEAFVSEEGSVELDALPAGRYRLAVAGTDVATVEIPEQTVLALR